MLCVSLSLLTAFSVTANAEQLKDFEIRQDVYIIKNQTSIQYENFLVFKPNDNQETVMEDVYSRTGRLLSNEFHRTVWNIFAPAAGYPFVLNKENRVQLNNFYYRILISGNTIRYVNDYRDIYALITYVDGTTERIEVSATIDSDMSLDISFKFIPTLNVQRFDVYVETDLASRITDAEQYTKIEFTSYLGEVKGDNKYNFDIEIQSEEATLLGGILGWIQNIFNKMGDTFDKLVDIGEYISELPSKIWGYIENGLKALFIPNSEDIEQFSAKMDTLLESKLGAVYQVSNTVIEAWERIQESDETDTINFPEATINLPDNNTFTFGGYNVKIVPDGFTFIVTTVKMVVGIVCTIAFVNGLRKKYDDVMEG